MIITIGNEGRYNFHGREDLKIICSPENAIKVGDKIVAYELTSRQIRRILNHYCGINGCLCRSHPWGYEQISHDRAIINV